MVCVFVCVSVGVAESLSMSETEQIEGGGCLSPSCHSTARWLKKSKAHPAAS